MDKNYTEIKKVGFLGIIGNIGLLIIKVIISVLILFPLINSNYKAINKCDIN